MAKKTEDRRQRTEDREQKTDEEKILIAGFGGQGIMLLGKVIAQAAVLEDRNVTYIRSYGAEMRGGTAHCLVRISDNQISSPVFDKATIAVIMNQPSLDKFKDNIAPGGLLILNESVFDKKLKRNDIKIKGLKMNELAINLGSVKVANIIGLGALLRERPFIRMSSAELTLKEIFKERGDLLESNLRALREGYNHG